MAIDIFYGKGQTPIDEDEKGDLIPSWITHNHQLNRLEQENINKAIGFFFTKKLTRKKLLTIPFMKNLHKKMLDDVWSWAGEFRLTDKNIGVTKTQIITSTYVLLEDINFWIDNKVFPNEEIVIRCKHRMVAIHPFVNGNGRHSRIFADLLMKSLGSAEFSWGSSLPNAREEYLAALRKADKNSYSDLLKFARS